MRISDWSSDVCSSDLHVSGSLNCCSSRSDLDVEQHPGVVAEELLAAAAIGEGIGELFEVGEVGRGVVGVGEVGRPQEAVGPEALGQRRDRALVGIARSEEHTSELQSLMRISYAVFCLKQKI